MGQPRQSMPSRMRCRSPSDSPDAEIILVNVQSLETLEVSDISAVIPAATDAARQSLKALRPIGPCRKGAMKFAARAGLGPIAQTTATLTRQLDADQIVVGTRRLGALRGLMRGSVATEVMRLANIPVTLVE